MLAWILETIKVSFEPGLEKRWQNEKLELQFFCRKKLGNCSKDTFYLTDCACSLSKKSHATRNYALTHSQVATDLSVWLILVSAGFAVTCN
ncbi:hypothetical protein EB796_011731 [Bugula neritina]|uniref:Uncharacterized protein n=1 Tax=Bugula neritina TaxID=10212 RepID=A0A7J7JW93_BUGNE|nr:hypothetical protein EB796_011731 [Bugula neritina]